MCFASLFLSISVYVFVWMCSCCACLSLCEMNSFIIENFFSSLSSFFFLLWLLLLLRLMLLLCKSSFVGYRTQAQQPPTTMMLNVFRWMYHTVVRQRAHTHAQGYVTHIKYCCIPYSRLIELYGPTTAVYCFWKKIKRSRRDGGEKDREQESESVCV